jgi:hypothetical protein
MYSFLYTLKIFMKFGVKDLPLGVSLPSYIFEIRASTILWKEAM